jgi:hypothetical protein
MTGAFLAVAAYALYRALRHPDPMHATAWTTVAIVAAVTAATGG